MTVLHVICTPNTNFLEYRAQLKQKICMNLLNYQSIYVMYIIHKVFKYRNDELGLLALQLHNFQDLTSCHWERLLFLHKLYNATSYLCIPKGCLSGYLS